jgi:hypothetical protein
MTCPPPGQDGASLEVAHPCASSTCAVLWPPPVCSCSGNPPLASQQGCQEQRPPPYDRRCHPANSTRPAAGLRPPCHHLAVPWAPEAGQRNKVHGGMCPEGCGSGSCDQLGASAYTRAELRHSTSRPAQCLPSRHAPSMGPLRVLDSHAHLASERVQVQGVELWKLNPLCLDTFRIGPDTVWHVQPTVPVAMHGLCRRSHRGSWWATMLSLILLLMLLAGTSAGNPVTTHMRVSLYNQLLKTDWHWPEFACTGERHCQRLGTAGGAATALWAGLRPRCQSGRKGYLSVGAWKHGT